VSITARRDDEGYLVDPDDWDEETAKALAAEEKLALGDEHWRLLTFMREYYADRRLPPDVRHVVDHLAAAHGYDRKAAKDLIFRLFPHGYVKQACKIAGMRRPRIWSTG
jgi:tRNA 2-thiouridine synthesizing protein E